MTNRGSGCWEVFCHRGWSNGCLHDRGPVGGFTIAGVEAQGLAKEDRCGLVLVAARGELSEQSVRETALRVETDDVAEVGLRLVITAKRDVGTRTQEDERDTVGLALERIAH